MSVHSNAAPNSEVLSSERALCAQFRSSEYLYLRRAVLLRKPATYLADDDARKEYMSRRKKQLEQASERVVFERYKQYSDDAHPMDANSNSESRYSVPMTTDTDLETLIMMERDLLITGPSGKVVQIPKQKQRSGQLQQQGRQQPQLSGFPLFRGLGMREDVELESIEEEAIEAAAIAAASSNSSLNRFVNTGSRLIGALKGLGLGSNQVSDFNPCTSYTFSQHPDVLNLSAAVTFIKFAFHEPDRLALATSNGMLHIAIASEVSMPQILLNIKAHSLQITALDWSVTNELVMTGSSDHTVKIWDSLDGKCIRALKCGGPVAALQAHPQNNNMLFIAWNNTGSGGSNPDVGSSEHISDAACLDTYNLSTGKLTLRTRLKSFVSSMVLDHAGDTLFVGDALGYVTCFRINRQSGELKALSRTSVNKGHAIHSLAFTNCTAPSGAISSLLLANTAQNAIFLLELPTRPTSDLKLVKKFPGSIGDMPIRSTFCPTASSSGGANFVSGGEDGAIYIFEWKRLENSGMCKLAAHPGSVLDVCFNFTESLLASSDNKGNAFLWRRKEPDDEAPLADEL